MRRRRWTAAIGRWISGFLSEFDPLELETWGLELLVIVAIVVTVGVVIGLKLLHIL